MTIIHLLIPLSILMAGGFLAAFFWAVRSGQFDDTTTPAMRVLLDDLGVAGGMVEVFVDEVFKSSDSGVS